MWGSMQDMTKMWNYNTIQNIQRNYLPKVQECTNWLSYQKSLSYEVSYLTCFRLSYEQLDIISSIHCFHKHSNMIWQPKKGPNHFNPWVLTHPNGYSFSSHLYLKFLPHIPKTSYIFLFGIKQCIIKIIDNLLRNEQMARLDRQCSASS